jgi:hypothetical protein
MGRSPRPSCVDTRLRVPVRHAGGPGVAVFLALASLVMLAFVVASVVAVGALLLRLVFFVILLPVRLVFGLLFIPFWIAKTVLKVAVGALMLPIFLVGGGLLAAVVAIGALVALVAPLVPLLIVGLLIWAVFRSFRPAVA